MRVIVLGGEVITQVAEIFRIHGVCGRGIDRFATVDADENESARLIQIAGAECVAAARCARREEESIGHREEPSCRAAMTNISSTCRVNSGSSTSVGLRVLIIFAT